MKHELKINPLPFEYVLTGEKTFEIRKNDRYFAIDDEIILKEWDEVSDDRMGYTGREVVGRITYLTDYAQQNGYVVFAFKKEVSHTTYDPHQRREEFLKGGRYG